MKSVYAYAFPHQVQGLILIIPLINSNQEILLNWKFINNIIFQVKFSNNLEFKSQEARDPQGISRQVICQKSCEKFSITKEFSFKDVVF